MKKNKFRTNYRNSNICSRFFYIFSDRLCLDVYKNNKKMLDEHIEDMTMDDTNDDKLLGKFE